MPHKDLLKVYGTYLQVECGLSRNSLSSYNVDLQKLDAYAKRLGKAIQLLEKEHLIDWIQTQAREGLAPRSIARRLSAIKGFYNFLQRDGLIQENPTVNLSMPQISIKIPKFLTEEEVESLLNAPDMNTIKGIRDRAILDVFYATGLRVSELVNLKIKDIELDRGLLSCNGKGSKQRTVPLGRAAAASLNEYLRVRVHLDSERSTDQFFLRGRGRSLTRHYIWSLLKKYSQYAGLTQVSPHTMRHSFATHLLNRGADSRTLQSLLGHSDLATTQIYTHTSNQHLSRTLEKFHPRSKK